MNNKKLYLKPNVVVEPLIDMWYGWAYLIPPLTSALIVSKRHIKVMESYIKNPQIHAAAVKNPAMLGGPFIDYGGKRVDEITCLLEDTKINRAHLFSLADAIQELDNLLASEANGNKLEPIYKKLPSLLKGYVELHYNRNNNASFRMVEPLLYASEHYDTSSQKLLLTLIDQDQRPSIHSMPRLVGEGEVLLDIPFENPLTDSVFRLTRNPMTLGEISDQFGLHAPQINTFLNFLTDEPPQLYQTYDGTGMRWRYFGHACILLEGKGTSILLDPILSYAYESDLSRFTFEDLPDFIDCVLITHNHQDHLLFETMLRLRERIGTIVVPRNDGGSLQDPSMKLILERIGFNNVVEMSELESIELSDGAITGIPFFGEHGDLEIRSKLAYLVRLGCHSLLFASDSCNIEPALYEHVHSYVGDIDVLFLGMECDGAPTSWVYGPLYTEALPHEMNQARRLSGSDFDQANKIVNQFNFKEVYVYAMGQEPWLTHISSKHYTDDSNPIIASNRLIDSCRERGIVSERLYGEKEILLP